MLEKDKVSSDIWSVLGKKKVAVSTSPSLLFMLSNVSMIVVYVWMQKYILQTTGYHNTGTKTIIFYLQDTYSW